MWINVARHHLTYTSNGHEKPKKKTIHIVYGVVSVTMDNGKHDVSITMSTIWNGLQRFDKEVIDKVGGNTRTEERFLDMLYFSGIKWNCRT